MNQIFLVKCRGHYYFEIDTNTLSRFVLKSVHKGRFDGGVCVPSLCHAEQHWEPMV